MNELEKRRQEDVKRLQSISAVSNFTILFIILLLTGCQSKAYLMPSPIGIRAEDHSFFQQSPEYIYKNRLITLYMPTTQPAG